MEKSIAEKVKEKITDNVELKEFMNAAYPEHLQPISAYRTLVAGDVKKKFLITELIAIRKVCGISIDEIIDNL